MKKAISEYSTSNLVSQTEEAERKSSLSSSNVRHLVLTSTSEVITQCGLRLLGPAGRPYLLENYILKLPPPEH